MKGACAVGYRLFEEIFYGQKMIMKNMIMNKKHKKLGKSFTVINDYSCIYNKCSEFLYTPIKKVEALGIDKHSFINVLNTELLAVKIKEQIEENYIKFIQQPLFDHRIEMAGKFKNRIDYVDISAYGVGKDWAKTPKDQEDTLEQVSCQQTIEDITAKNHKIKQNSMFEKIHSLKNHSKNIEYSICSWAQRYDERMDMIFNKKMPDQRQKYLT